MSTLSQGIVFKTPEKINIFMIEYHIINYFCNISSKPLNLQIINAYLIPISNMGARKKKYVMQILQFYYRPFYKTILHL